MPQRWAPIARTNKPPRAQTFVAVRDREDARPPPARVKRVCIYCGSSPGSLAEYAAAARHCGAVLAEAQTVRRHALHRRDPLRVRVTQNHRAPRADVIDELPPVRGDDAGSGRLLEEDRFSADAAKRAHR